MIILGILSNLSLLALFCMLSLFFGKYCAGARRAVLVHGLFFGLACVVGMMHPLVVAPGIIYDGRSIMLSLCGLFFGPAAAGIAAFMALVCRISLGGPGATAGVLVIVSAPLLGIACRFWKPRQQMVVSAGQLMALGLVVHVAMLLIQWLALPTGMGLETVKKIAVPVMLAYPLVTVMVGKVLSDNLERDRLLDELLGGEERFRMTLYSIGDGLIVTDDKGRVTHLNPIAEQLTGWPEVEARGRPCTEVFNIVNEDTREVVVSPVERVLREGKIVGLANHTLLIGRNGKACPIADSGAPIRGAEGRIIGVVLVFRDQTHERESQCSLEKSERRIRGLIENAPIGIFTTTSDGRFMELNDAMAQILGYLSAEVALQDNPDLGGRFYVCKERRGELLQRLEQDGQVKLFEVELATVDQRRIWLSLNARVIRHNGDGTFHIEGFAVDITERKRKEMEVLRSINRMGGLLRILQYPVRNVQELLDYALEEVIQLTSSKIGYIYHYSEVLHEFVLNTWSKDVMKECAVINPQTCYELSKTGLWGEAVRQRKPIVVNDFDVENPFKKGYPEGHVHLRNFLTVPIFQGDEIVGVVGVANKATGYDQEDVIQLQVLMGSVWKEVARKNAEDAQDKLAAQLNQAQKMEAVGRLAGGVAHDFNNILQAMIGYSELLQEMVADRPNAHELVTEVVSEGKRAAGLTNQLLAFARKQAVHPQVIDINEAVAALVKMLKRLLGENIELAWCPGETLFKVKIDTGQLDQVLANLTVNARDAITGAGKVTIETANVYLDDEYCSRHVGMKPGSYVMLAVSDNGCGMDKELLENIFEPFFTTKERGKGTGLGLATVYGIVRQNGGHINVYSEQGKGTTFKIYLAAYFDDETEGVKKVVPVGVLPIGTETILVVDDEESMLRSVQMILQSLGYKVISAPSADEALSLSQAYADEIHLLLTDVVMPKRSGRELQQALAAHRPHMKCVFMSGYTANVIAHHGILEEGIHFIQKPFTKADLALKIRDVLAG